MSKELDENFSAITMVNEELQKLNQDIKLLTDISNELNAEKHLLHEEKIDKLIELNSKLNLENFFLKEKIDFLNNKNMLLEKQIEEFESYKSNNKLK